VGLSSAFLGSSIAYADVKILEDQEGCVYRWTGKNAIEAKCGADSVYGMKILTVEEMEGRWAITKIEYYDSKSERLTKERENRHFVKVYGAWRPTQVIVTKEKSKYSTTLELDWDSPTVFDHNSR
jgi:hypothetical protein